MVGAKDQVIYFHHATKEDAAGLGRALKNIGYFADKGSGVVLDKSRSGTTVSPSSSPREPGLSRMPFTTTETWRASSLQPWADSRWLCAVVRPKTRDPQRPGGRQGTRRDAEQQPPITTARPPRRCPAFFSGQSLRSAGALRDTGMTVVLAKGDVTTLSFVVHQSPWEHPEAVNAFETLTRQVAPVVGGLPVKLRFLDTTGRSRKEVSVE